MCKQTFTHEHPYVYKCKYMYIYMHVSTYTHLYVHIYSSQHVDLSNINALCLGGGTRCSGRVSVSCLTASLPCFIGDMYCLQIWNKMRLKGVSHKRIFTNPPVLDDLQTQRIGVEF